MQQGPSPRHETASPRGRQRWVAGRPAAASSTQAHRLTHARRPAPALLAPPVRTDQTCLADRIPSPSGRDKHKPGGADHGSGAAGRDHTTPDRR